VGAFDDEEVDDVEDVADDELEDGAWPGPLCPLGMLPTDGGKGPVVGPPRGPLPRALSMDMCDCSSDWSIRP
jgi:hypothetical protein